MSAMDAGAPRNFGRQAEFIVMYLLERRGFKVAHVDHAGADLIASDATHRDAQYAISVKARNLSKGESKSFGLTVKDESHLREFSHAFGLVPAVAWLITDPRLSAVYQQIGGKPEPWLTGVSSPEPIDCAYQPIHTFIHTLDYAKKQAASPESMVFTEGAGNTFRFRVSRRRAHEAFSDSNIDHTMILLPSSADALSPGFQWDRL